MKRDNIVNFINHNKVSTPIYIQVCIALVAVILLSVYLNSIVIKTYQTILIIAVNIIIFITAIIIIRNSKKNKTILIFYNGLTAIIISICSTCILTVRLEIMFNLGEFYVIAYTIIYLILSIYAIIASTLRINAGKYQKQTTPQNISSISTISGAAGLIGAAILGRIGNEIIKNYIVIILLAYITLLFYQLGMVSIFKLYLAKKYSVSEEEIL